MRFTLIVLLALAVSPALAQPADSLRAEEEFMRAVQSFQHIYVSGDDENCEEILAMVDEHVDFSENGESWTKNDMIQYCPHLPSKNILETISSHRLLTPDLAYDFMSYIYVSSNQEDRMRETISRIWRRSASGWTIIKMDAVISPVVD